MPLSGPSRQLQGSTGCFGFPPVVGTRADAGPYPGRLIKSGRYPKPFTEAAAHLVIYNRPTRNQGRRRAHEGSLLDRPKQPKADYSECGDYFRSLHCEINQLLKRRHFRI
jgi:hypothetical protein